MTPLSPSISITGNSIAPSSAAGIASVVVVDPSCYSLPYDYSLCEALAQHGCRVTLARSEFLYAKWSHPRSFEDWNHFYPLAHGYASRYGRNRAWKYAKAAEHIFCMQRLARELHKRKPDVVHFQWLPVPAIDRWYVRKISRMAPVVLTMHNTTTPVHGSVSKLQKLNFRSVYQDFSAVIVHSEFSKQKVIEQGWVPADRIHVIPHGVFDYYSAEEPWRQQKAISEQVILFFGRIEAYKGLDVLIEAFAMLPRRLIETTRLVIAGLPRIDIQPLQERCRALHIDDRLTWHSRFIAEDEIAPLFRSASMVALPYRDIDQSGVLMTAVAFDKPVVASRIGGIPETIRDGVHGRLVEPGNVESFAKALQSILSDAGLRNNMSKSIRYLKTGELSWERVSQKTLAVYEKITGRDLSTSRKIA